MEVAPKIITPALIDLCKEFDVEELYLFGSAVAGVFNTDSDLDFIVKFKRDGYEGAFEQFITFKQRLEHLFDRPVDLYTKKRFRNKYFDEEVQRTRQLIYAA